MRPSAVCRRRLLSTSDVSVSRSASQTSSVASTSKLPAKTASRRNSCFSSSLLGRVAGAPAQERQALLQALEQLRRVQHLRPRGGELDRERQVVQPSADLADVRVRLKRGPRRPYTLHEQRHGVLVGQRRHRVFPLTGQMEWRAAGHEDLHRRRLAQELRDLGRGLQQLLEIVEQKQCLPVREVLLERFRLPDSECLRDRRKHGPFVA